MTNKLVESIVKTYDLSPKMEYKVIKFAIRGLNKLRSKGFDDIYNFVGRVIDGFRVPFGERMMRERFANWNEQQSDSEDPFNCLFGVEDPNLVDLLELPDEKTSVDEALNILGEIVSKSDLKLLQQLAYQKDNSGGKSLSISPEKILFNVETIQRRLEELAKKYEQNGKLVLPRRTIWHIQFNPLVIKHKRYLNQRDIDEVLVAHEICNGNATRAARRIGCCSETVKKYWETAGLDSLRRSIPEEKQKIIINAHEIYRGNATEVARLTGVSRGTVLNYWEKNGLEAENWSEKTLKDKIDLIEVHKKCNGIAAEAARQLGHSEQTIIRNWKDLGLKPRGTKLSEEEQKEIIDSYELSQGNVSEAVRLTGYSHGAIMKYWRENELEIQKTGRMSLPQEKIDEIVAAHKTCDGFASEAAKKVGSNSATVRKYWEAEGLRAKQGLSQNQIDEVVAAHETFDGNLTQADKNLPYAEQTIRKYWEAAGLESKEPGGQSLAQSQIEEILAAHGTFQGNASKASKTLNHSASTIIKYWRKNELEIQETGGGHSLMPKKKIDEIVDAYDICDGNASEAARRLDCTPDTARKYWVAAGLEPKGPGGRHLIQSKIKEIVNAHGPSQGVASEAAEIVGCSIFAVIKYWRKEGLEIQAGGGHPVLSPKKIDDIKAGYKIYEGNAAEAARELDVSYNIVLRHWRKSNFKPQGNSNLKTK